MAGKKVWEVDCSFHVLKGPSKGRDAQSRNRVAGPQKKILLVSKLWHEATMHTGPKPIPDWFSQNKWLGHPFFVGALQSLRKESKHFKLKRGQPVADKGLPTQTYKNMVYLPTFTINNQPTCSPNRSSDHTFNWLDLGKGFPQDFLLAESKGTKPAMLPK